MRRKCTDCSDSCNYRNISQGRSSSSKVMMMMMIAFSFYVFGIGVGVYAGNEEEEEIMEENDNIKLPHRTPSYEVRAATSVQVQTWYNFLDPSKHWVELAAFVWMILYAINYVYGSRRNAKMAQHWFQAQNPLLEENFAQVGGGPDSATMIEEAKNEFKVYSTGRRNCYGCLLELSLLRRQDLISSLFFRFILPTHDRLLVQIPLYDEMEPFVFSILRKAELMNTVAELSDITTYAREVPLEFLPRSLCCLTDCDELIAIFLTSQIVKDLAVGQHLIDYIHVSDQNVISRMGYSTKKAIFAQFRYQEADLEELNQVLRAVFSLVDLAGTVIISAKAKQKAIARRQAVSAARVSSAKAQSREEFLEAKRAKMSQEEKEKLLKKKMKKKTLKYI